MSDAPQVLLDHHLKTLKLPTFLREYGKLARQCASEGVDHVRYLHRLAELELIDRERRMVERRIKAARFPVVKSLDAFDFKVIPSLDKTLVLELARCEYVDPVGPQVPPARAAASACRGHAASRAGPSRGLRGQDRSRRWPLFTPPLTVRARRA